jgi:hypothetical protein
MRDRQVITDASVCENAHALRDPSVQTVSDIRAKGIKRCPVFDRCMTGTLLGPDKLNCIPTQGQNVARYAAEGGVSVVAEMSDFRKAPFFSPPSKGFIDPYDDPNKVVTDRDEICKAVEGWATAITNRAPTVPQNHCAKHTTYSESCRDCRAARVIQADTTDIVYPGGIATRVPRNKCRCPVLRVGDFCPVHGG